MVKVTAFDLKAAMIEALKGLDGVQPGGLYAFDKYETD